MISASQIIEEPNEIHREPSNRDVSADGEASSAAASQGQAAHAGTGSETLASHEGDTQGEGSGASVLSPINSEPVSGSLTSLEMAEAVERPGIAPASLPPVADETGRFPDLPARFDRRPVAA